MKLAQYKLLLKRFLKEYPGSCIATKRKAYAIIDNPPIDEDGEILINPLTDDLCNPLGSTLPDTIFEFLPICGCGDPVRAARIYLQALEWCAKGSLTRSDEKPFKGNEDLFLIVLYVLSSSEFNLTQHDYSILGSFLTDKGEVALEILREWDERHGKGCHKDERRQV